MATFMTHSAAKGLSSGEKNWTYDATRISDGYHVVPKPKLITKYGSAAKTLTSWMDFVV